MASIPADAGMKIGALAALSGLSVKTLRFYEDQGLLPALGRSPGGYRLFNEESLRRVAFIRRLKALGLSLDDIRQCLVVHDAGQLPCADLQQQLELQIERIDGRITELEQLRQQLRQTLQGWQRAPRRQGDEICPNLQV